MAEYLKLGANSSLYRKGVALFGRTTDSSGLTLSAGSIISLNETVSHNDSTGVTVTSVTQFTLAANKRYALYAMVSATHAAATVFAFQFYNVTTAAYIGLPGRAAAASYTNNLSYTNSAHAVISPSVITTVEVRVSTISGSTLSGIFSGSHVYVEELEAYIPAVGPADYVIENNSNSNGSYTKWYSGKLEQWGRKTITATPTTITLPTAFVNTSFTVLALPDDSANVTCVTSEDAAVRAVGAFGVNTFVSTSGANSNTVINWHAIGQWK